MIVLKVRPGMSQPVSSLAFAAEAHRHALDQLAEAARLLGLDDRMRQTILSPHRSVRVDIPLHRGKGHLVTARAFRVHHNIARGPAKGPVHFTPHLDLPGVTAQAIWTTWKHALAGIPFGGASGALAIEPESLTSSEYELLVQRYITEVFPLIGGDADIPTSERGSSDRLRAWFLDHYSPAEPGETITESRSRGHLAPDRRGIALAHDAGDAVVGGPNDLTDTSQERGTPVCAAERTDAVARGMVFATLEHLDVQALKSARTRVAIYGLGSPGAAAARHFAGAGCAVVALADSTGGCHHGGGLDVDDLLRLHAAGMELSEYGGAQAVSGEEALELDVDVLAIASARNPLLPQQVELIGARLVVEGADMAITPRADEVLADSGIVVLPDILAAAGDAIYSYLEWVRSLHSYPWAPLDLDRHLHQIVADTYHLVRSQAIEKRLSYRHAAHSIAVDRVAQAQCRL